MSTTPPYTEEHLRQAYSICDPSSPVEAGSELYIDFGSDRGEDHPDQRIVKTIRLSEKPTCHLLAGHRGVGKSTELRRIKRQLESRPGYRVILIEAEKFLDLQDVTYIEVVLVLLKELSEQLKEQDEITLSAGYFKSRWAELKELFGREVNLSEGQIKAGDVTAKLVLESKSSVAIREKIRKHLEDNSASFLDEANQLILTAQVELAKKSSAQLVLLIDGLDRILVVEQARKLFLNHASELRSLGCHLVYTVPIGLIYDPSANSIFNAFGLNPLVIPMIKILDKVHNRHETGIQKLKTLLCKRLESRRIPEPQLVIAGSGLEQLVMASGGHVRGLLTLFRTAMTFDDSFPLQEHAVQRSIQQMRNDYSRSIPEAHWPLLAKVYQDKKIENDEAHQQMLFNLSVMEYLNGEEPWHDVNPVILELSKFKDTLSHAGTKANQLSE